MKHILVIIFCAVHFYTSAQCCFEGCNKAYANANSMEEGSKIVAGLVGCKAPAFSFTSIDGKALNSDQLRYYRKNQTRNGIAI